MIVMKLESRVLVPCGLECGQVDMRRFGEVIRGEDGPSVLEGGGSRRQWEEVRERWGKMCELSWGIEGDGGNWN